MAIAGLRMAIAGLRMAIAGLRMAIAGLRTEFGGLRTEFGGLRTAISDRRRPAPPPARTRNGTMSIEIERKFLVADESWRAAASPGMRYRQGYLSTDPSNSVRVRVSGDKAWLNVKSATVGIARREYEYGIPAADAHEILEELCVKPIIEKTRFVVEHAGHAWEVDVFEGENSGLVVAEIELQSVDEAFALPTWAGEDVTGDVRYHNQRLVEHPYSRWDPPGGS